MRKELPPAPLSRAGQRALSAFLDGRLPAGRLHEELLRATEPLALSLTPHSASIPVPPPLERAPA